MLFQTVLVAVGLLCVTNAAPAQPEQFPDIPLPSTYPRPHATYNATTPTHFSLTGYSLDGTIVGVPYYANASIPNITAGQLLPIPASNTTSTYGTYAFGIGPKKHIFAMNDGRIGFMSTALRPNSSTAITYFFFDSWKHYLRVNRASVLGSEPKDPIPTCAIVSGWNLLQCSLNNTSLEFGYCGENVNLSPKGYGPDSVVWGTEIESVKGCKKIVLKAEQVPKEFGDSVAKTYCAEHPTESGC